MHPAAAAPPEMTLVALVEHYRHYALNIRNANAGMVRKRYVYLHRLFNFMGCPPSAAALFAGLTAKKIGAFLVDYAPRHGPGSRRDMHATLRAFLRYAYEERFTPQDLSVLVPAVRQHTGTRLPRGLPEACIAALELSIGRYNPEGRRDAAIVCLLNTYGVRGAQIRGLRLTDIDWERERIRFQACKGGRLIEQHLTAKAGNRLSEYIAGGRPVSSSREVFLMQATGAALTRDRVYRDYHRLCRYCGIWDQPPPRLHDLRHNYACQRLALWRAAGGDVETLLPILANAMGHVNFFSTQLYIHVDAGTLRHASSKFNAHVKQCQENHP